MENNSVEPRFVSVVWDDAWADGTDSVTTTEQDLKHRPTRMETRGWLLADDSHGVSLFNERCLDSGGEMYRSRTFIPRAMIHSVLELGAKPRARKRTKKLTVQPGTPPTESTTKDTL